GSADWRVLSLPPSVRLFVATRPVDGRKGPDSVMALVRDVLRHDPLSGHLFIFFSKRCDRVRIVYWDRNGYAMWTKRLEKGRFRPIFSSDKRLSSVAIEACPCWVPRHLGVSRSQVRHLGDHGGFPAGAGSPGGGAHRWQETARFTASRRPRALPRATTSSSGRFLAVPRYISSGVWPANAECGIFALCWSFTRRSGGASSKRSTTTSNSSRERRARTSRLEGIGAGGYAGWRSPYKAV